MVWTLRLQPVQIQESLHLLLGLQDNAIRRHKVAVTRALFQAPCPHPVPHAPSRWQHETLCCANWATRPFPGGANLSHGRLGVLSIVPGDLPDNCPHGPEVSVPTVLARKTGVGPPLVSVPRLHAEPPWRQQDEAGHLAPGIRWKATPRLPHQHAMHGRSRRWHHLTICGTGTTKHHGDSVPSPMLSAELPHCQACTRELSLGQAPGEI